MEVSPRVRVSHKHFLWGGALPSIWEASGVRNRRSNQLLVGEQSISAHVNIPTSAIALHTPALLSIVLA